MSDRTCIHSDGKDNFHYSTEDLLSCCKNCGSCDGGFPYVAYEYWKNHGIVSGGQYNSSEGCMPYQIAPCEHHIDGELPECSSEYNPTPKCEHKCQSSYATSYEEDLRKGESIYKFMGEDAAMYELVTNGPINSNFDVYSDFLSYKSGVYQLTEYATYLGGHAIRVIGYGSENGVPYWLCANSWNTDWGDEGLFKIIRGKNECNIELHYITGTPKLD